MAKKEDEKRRQDLLESKKRKILMEQGIMVDVAPLGGGSGSKGGRTN